MIVAWQEMLNIDPEQGIPEEIHVKGNSDAIAQFNAIKNNL